MFRNLTRFLKLRFYFTSCLSLKCNGLFILEFYKAKLMKKKVWRHQRAITHNRWTDNTMSKRLTTNSGRQNTIQKTKAWAHSKTCAAIRYSGRVSSLCFTRGTNLVASPVKPHSSPSNIQLIPDMSLISLWYHYSTSTSHYYEFQCNIQLLLIPSQTVITDNSTSKWYYCQIYT